MEKKSVEILNFFKRHLNIECTWVDEISNVDIECDISEFEYDDKLANLVQTACKNANLQFFEDGVGFVVDSTHKKFQNGKLRIRVVSTEHNHTTILPNKNQRLIGKE